MSNYITSIDKNILDNLLEEVLNRNLNCMKIPHDIDKKNIILYGAGNLGTMAVNLLRKVGIKPKYIVDKSEKKHSGNISGIKIVHPNEIFKNDKRDAIFLVCIVNFPFSEIKDSLYNMGCQNIIPFWDIAEYFRDEIKITNGWYCEKLSEKDKVNIKLVYDNFNDDISRALYIQFLYWRIRREEILFEQAKVSIEDKFFPEKIMPKLTENEFLVDCGAYNGNTIKNFMDYTKNKFKKIVAFEPDKSNYKELINFINKVDKNISKKIIPYPYGVGEIEEEKMFISGLGMAGRFGIDSNSNNAKIVTLDNILKNDSISFLKLHVEGEEYRALKGGLKVIRKNRPIIIITIYHNMEGLWMVPRLLMEELEDYYYYHRLHGYCGNESVLYAFPKERI